MKGVAVLAFAAALATRARRVRGGPTLAPGCHRDHYCLAASHIGDESSGLASASATTNERLFADGEAASIPLTLALVVAGTLMRAYARFQHAYGAAWGAIGQPFSSENVTRMAGGFKLCSAGTGSGSGCSAFTQFTADDAGRITGVSVNGRAVAGRIAPRLRMPRQAG